MGKPIIVVGHKNPDNDSIASAVSLAYLNNQIARRDAGEDGQDTREYMPACLGALPPESQWVLESTGLEEPTLIDNVYPLASDVMTQPVIVNEDATMVDVMKTMHEANTGAVAILDSDDKYLGLVTMRMVGQCCVRSTTGSGDSLTGSFTSELYQNAAAAKDKLAPVFAPDTTAAEAAETFGAISACWGAIVDADESFLGAVSRTDLLEAPKRDVVLVDHNEICQAVDGICDANIVQVLDHHRIGDIATANPIQFLALPWGSTATIVATRFRHEKVEIPQSIAMLLLSAILTDTVIMKSPTTTDIDKRMVEYLSEIAGVDAQEFGLQVFRCRGGEENVDIKEFVCSDSKEFKVGDTCVLIAQHETVDLDGAMNHEDDARAYMRELAADNDYDFVLLMVTDILAEGSNFLVEGNHAVVDRVFGIDTNAAVWMPGILSRKKQVAAPILGA